VVGAQHMQIKIRQVMAAVALTGAAFAVVRYLIVDNRPEDILKAMVSAIDGDFTLYAKGYSESRFRTVRIGMTTRQVKNLLGAPLNWDTPETSEASGEGIWCYTRPGKSPGSYWVRHIAFRNGVVDDINMHFYMD